MKTKDFEKWLKIVDKDITEWNKAIAKNYEPAFLYMSLEPEKLNFLRAKGFITYQYDKDWHEIASISLTDLGETYFVDKKIERKKWLIRSVITPIIISVFTTLITYWLIGK